ncbi:hypothetical protein QNN97_01000 [Arthrobacter sp. zg.Y20]|nr:MULTISPECIES: hypothetical protein [unclassified Arthrobacter]MDK1314608.1 hypothetical protein [Arthrobacter sp. zg.Y20]WIB07589.1 hypothetical protein QNO06_07745 [Arthrobacter sp. zg-Y20]
MAIPAPRSEGIVTACRDPDKPQGFDAADSYRWYGTRGVEVL